MTFLREISVNCKMFVPKYFAIALHKSQFGAWKAETWGWLLVASCALRRMAIGSIVAD